MIAPPGSARKSLSARQKAGGKARSRGSERIDRASAAAAAAIWTGRNHGFVKRIIMRPHFSQARAKLACDMRHCCLTARSGSCSGFLSPPAPRSADGPGQSQRTVQSPNPSGRLFSRPFFACATLRHPRTAPRTHGRAESPGRSLRIFISIRKIVARQTAAQWTLIVRCRSSVICWPICSSAAPSTMPGFSRLPFCTMTAAASMRPSAICDNGTLQVDSAPL
jgi:hypothetical protein